MNAAMRDLLASSLSLPVDSLNLQRISGTPDQGVYFLSALGEELVVKSFRGENAVLQMKTECLGLKALAQSCTIIKIPQIHAEIDSEDLSAFYLMDRIVTVTGHNRWEELGVGLAELHSNRRESHGLGYSNFIASIPQVNTETRSWPVFFSESRILPLIALATQELPSSLVSEIETLCNRMEDLLPDEPPSLLHGDLWAGNFLVSMDHPWLIDPAIYYGSREMDIAMTQLFGGFDKKMIDAYHHHFPLEPGWEERLDLCNLYPLLVHVNLFGASYVNQVIQLLRKYNL